ncbi:unnamed protein product [Fraxinus pennsylvanica]|uniref:PB1 domain-containing protein n=1 Tax=Fraxinus pennsylvanica TaxID=56036 RepID=A0AAD1Z803_9LAMI|nr:unnamed protein product [Fraxinus pennsylvanica]
MSTEGNNVEETLSCGSAPSSNPGSPRNRVKFLCSHGGKILPRPTDGHLKYVGGETRVISVPRDIAFQELMKKLTSLIDGEMILKYQLVPEELDALVSVKSDEDLRHMFNECDRHGSAKFPSVRAFLFPAAPVVMENQIGTMEPHALEQRYIDAINGIIRTTSAGIKQHRTINITQNGSFVSSACSSPRSPENYTAETINNETMIFSNNHNGRSHLHKVRSSPNICSLNVQHNSNYCNYRQPHHPCYQYPKLPVDLSRNVVPERFISVRSIGRAEGVRCQTDQAPQYFYSASRQRRGSGCCTKCKHYEECNPCSDRRGSPATSPLFLSPRHGASGTKAWDSIIAGDS